MIRAVRVSLGTRTIHTRKFGTKDDVLDKRVAQKLKNFPEALSREFLPEISIVSRLACPCSFHSPISDYQGDLCS